jgi:hypothetical protein
MSANPEHIDPDRAPRRRVTFTSPDPEEQPEEPEFSDSTTEAFIDALADDDEPIRFLESWGIGAVSNETAGMLQEMAKVWRKDSSKVHAACGAWFWQAMKQGALSKFNFESVWQEKDSP